MPKDRINISDALVHTLPLQSGAHVDEALPGFMVICGRRSRSYVFQREVNKRSVRVTLGRVGKINADTARLRALAAQKQIEEGQNPNAVKRIEEAKAMTLEEAFELYKESEKRSSATLSLYEMLFRLYLKPWAGNRTIAEIGDDTAGARKLHKDITARVKAHLATMCQEQIDRNKRRRKPREVKPISPRAGQSTANNALLLLSGIYTRARKEVRTLPENPVENVNWHESHIRQSSLTPDALQDWYEKVHRLSSPIRRTYWLAVILTGARRTSVAEARWIDVDLDNARWHFPLPKGGEQRRYTVPISRFLLDRLRELKATTEQLFPGTEWVFPSEEAQCGHTTKPRNDRQGLPMAHSLRHTYRTISLLAGISDVHSHLLMNHRLQGVNYNYISREVAIDDLAESQEKITKYFLKAFGVIKEDAAPVVVKGAPKKGATLFELELKRSMTARRKAR